MQDLCRIPPPHIPKLSSHYLRVSSPVLLLLPVGNDNFDNDNIGKAEAVAKKTKMMSDALIKGGTIDTIIKK